MKSLSIVIKDSIQENIYNSINLLKPLLEDGNGQLIIINNIKNKFQIDYEHIVYEFEEDYEKFYGFCEASNFNDNLMIIEDGVVLTEELVGKIKELMLKHANINIKVDFKKYYYKDNYYIEEKTFVYTNKNLKEEKINIKIDDFAYVNNLGINLKHNISRFVKDGRIKEFHVWYENYIIKDDEAKFRFYNYMEKYKMQLEDYTREEIDRYFILGELDFKYCQYLKIMKSFKENKLSADYLKNIIPKSNFNERDVYFSYIIFEAFKRKKLINDIFTTINNNIIKVYIKNLFDEYKDFDLNIYEFLISIDIEEELKSGNNENVQIYMNLIERYYENISSSFMDKDKKEKLIRLLIDYSNCGSYCLKNNLNMDKRKKEVLVKLEVVKNLINSNQFEEAADVLFELGEILNIIKLPSRYYAQKIIDENKVHSNILSIPMIVKNEEKNLERCLKSLGPLLENKLAELIIVDTGSTDKTVEIAKKYTNKVYFHPWQGDFSEARNWSISLARGEYIFIIDADNEFDESEINKYIKIFKSKDYRKFNSFSYKVKNYEDENNIKFSIISQNNIFKNDGTFYYSGTVHNQPNFNEPVKNLDIMVHHYGYIMNNKEARDRKFNRTGYILKKELEKEPLNIYYRYQLTKSYSVYGNYKESLNQTKLYMKLLDVIPLNYNYIVYYNAAAVVYFCNKLYDDAIKICDNILSIVPDFIDALYFKAMSLFLKENYGESINYYKFYLNSLNNVHKNPIINDTRLEFYSLDSIEIVKRDIMTAYLKIPNYLELLEYVFCEDKSNIVIYQFGIINSFIKLNKFDELAVFYKKNINCCSDSDKLDFIYYIKNEMENLDVNKIKKLLDEFDKLNIKDQYFNLLKQSIEKKKKNSLRDIIRFLEKQDMEILNIIVIEKPIYDLIIILINDGDIDLTLREIIAIRKVIKNIIMQVLNKKSISGLNREQLIKIILKYMNYSFLVYEESKENLSLKEILFLENMNKSLQYIQKKDFVSAVREIKDAVIEDEDMANAMALYIENLINGNEQSSKNKEMESYSLLVKNEINKLIEQGNYEDAKKLIKEYETIVENDLEAISMKAVIAIIEERLDDAEEILREGLSIDSNYYDLLYNMAYLQQLKENHFLANYFSEEAQRVLNKENHEKDSNIEILDKKSKYLSKEEKTKNAPKILIGGTVRQKPLILKEFLKSLSELYIQDYNVNFLFFDDNKEEESSQLLNNFNVEECSTSILSGEKQGEYICNDDGHKWKDELIWKIAGYKDKIIDYARINNYDYLFFIDSDLVLHPETLEKLISTKKYIISEVFWTKWDSSDVEKPQVWISGNYTLYYKSENESLTQEEIKSRTNAFIKCMRVPGVYEVGGLGACTLISKKALDKGVCYKKLEGVNYMGEDRHFCIRALEMGLKLHVETSIPAYHIYREEYLKGVEDYKNKCRKAIIYKYDNFTRTAVKSKNNTLTLSMLVRNEADRYLRKVLEHASQYIDRAVILDDGSNDNTVEVCKEVLKDIPLTIVSNKVSKFNNEISLRKQLWEMTVATDPDWILCLDADEVFENKAKSEMKNIINQPYYDYYDFRLYDFWDKEYYREDKNWCAHKYYRSFLVRYQPNFKYVWNETPVHCGRLPLNIYNLPGAISNLRIKHYGWSNEKERIEKYKRYMEHDPEGKFGVMEQYKSILDETPNLVKWEE